MKLLDLLVQELPERGGWPEAASYVVQDYDGTVKFSKSINFLHIKAGEWCSNEDGDDWIYGDRPFEGNFHHYITANDWKVSIVTREQYKTALAASKAVVGHDGWIQWSGGDCPVDSDAIVEAKYRNPNQYQFNSDRAGDFYWSHDGLGYDIIAYRPWLHSRANDDRLEQDLNECIGQGVDMPEWNGDGLPPVGIKCEHCPGGTTQHEWEVVTVAGVHENTSTGFTDYWLVRENGSSYIVGNPYRFRPLRTEAEKALESAKHIIAELCRDSASNGHSADLIMEAITAGKIPGVKLEGK